MLCMRWHQWLGRMSIWHRSSGQLLVPPHSQHTVWGDHFWEWYTWLNGWRYRRPLPLSGGIHQMLLCLLSSTRATAATLEQQDWYSKYVLTNPKGSVSNKRVEKPLKSISVKHMKKFYISVAVPIWCMQLTYSSKQNGQSHLGANS